MYNLKKEFGYWCVQLASSSLTIFKSLSRATAIEWKAVNSPIPAHDVLNASSGKAVWRKRDIN